jgi:glycerol-3-phosphate dehydrogenase
MNRLQNIKSETYDVLILGGGITGANVLWDATLRNLDCILIEKNDFASGTSMATSKLIHGGLRYLKNFEIGLVRESLRERKILAKLTPHSIRPMGFLLPIYSYKSKIVLKIGLLLYDLLSFDRNNGLVSDVLLPSHIFLNKERTISEDPNIPRDHLIGSFLYYDYANVNPERHTYEFILSAKQKGGIAFNYIELINIQKKDSIFHVELKDKFSEKKIELKTKTIINSTGPWADKTDLFLLSNPQNKIIRSKGIHIITRNIAQKHTTVIQTKSKKHLFVIPWRGLTLIGTTDTAYDDHPDNFKVSRYDIDILLREVNEYLNFKINESDIQYSFGGLRPLVEDSNSKVNTYDASRKTEIFDHGKDGMSGYFTAMGGKYTTSRNVAEQVIDQVSGYLQKGSSCVTKNTHLISGDYTDIPSLVKELKTMFIDMDDERAYVLSMRYGSMARKILHQKNVFHKDPLFRMPFGNREPYYLEELVYIIQNEDVLSFEDFYFRRSGIGTTGILEDITLHILIDLYNKYSKNPDPNLNIDRIKNFYHKDF